MEEVLFSTNNNGVATITLNRPKALNSLNYNMLVPMKEKLTEWEKDNTIQVIILKSSSSRAFCAGGDIKTLHAAKESDAAMQAAEEFFRTEYETDELIHNFSKPIIAVLDGIVMGGGVGISYGASHRIVTENTKWAMPEMNIGFFPDVGAAYFLNKAPGASGKYLALTGSVIPADDVIYTKGADIFCTTENLPKLLEDIENTNWNDGSVIEKLNTLFEEYGETPPPKGQIAASQELIDKHFAHDTVEEIVASLALDTDEFVRKTKETILSKSPVSLKVTLKQLMDGDGKSLEECLATDLILAKNFIRHDDFFEGVRSVLIDKDQNPEYQYKKLEDVSESFVNSFFEEP